MIIKTLFFSKTFPHTTNGTWAKVGLEAEVTPDEDVRKCLYALKKEVEEFHYQSLGHDEKVAAEQKEVVLDENGAAIAGILLAKDIPELETYQFRTTQSKAVKAAYNQRLKQLQNGLEQNPY